MLGDIIQEKICLYTTREQKKSYPDRYLVNMECIHLLRTRVPYYSLADIQRRRMTALLECVIKDNRSYLVRLALRYVSGSRSDAEDVIQNVCVYALKTIDRFKIRKGDRAETSMLKWLTKMVSGKGIDLTRHKMTRREVLTDGSLLDFITDQQHEQHVLDEFQTALDLVSGSDRQKHIMNETIINGKSASEISNELGCSESSIYVHRSRMRKKLGKLYKELNQ